MDFGVYLKKLRFGRVQKIKRRNEISQLFKNGRRWECGCFTLIYEQNDLQCDRFGVIVSKKIGNAVERNKAKRIFREVFRCNIQRVPPFFDILIKPKPAADFFWNVGEQKDFFDKWQKEAKNLFQK